MAWLDSEPISPPRATLRYYVRQTVGLQDRFIDRFRELSVLHKPGVETKAVGTSPCSRINLNAVTNVAAEAE